MANHPQENGGWATEFRKLVPTLILTALIGFGSSWWSNQISQNDLRYRVEALEKRVESLGAQVTQNGATINQNAIRQAEFTVIQNNIVDQMRDLKEEQRRR
jgi:hypothetical protein